MMKVFPLEHRMYMPDIRKLTKKATVVLKNDTVNGDKEECPIKHFIMYKIAETMHIYYDICGVKYHFCEPDTVRTLVEYNGFLNDLDNRFRIKSEQLVCYSKLENKNMTDREKIIENNMEILRSYDSNHERFNWDIMKRLAQTTLNQYQSDYFRNLMERDLGRRAMYFVSSENCVGQIVMQDINAEQYTYGDFIEKIYTWGRENYEDKALISCVMASFTSEMVREYIFYRYVGDKDKRQRSLERLKKFIGNGFSNKWVGDVFPQIVYVTEDNKIKTKEMGYINAIEHISFRLEYGIEELRELNKIKIIKENQRVVEDVLEKWFEKTNMVPVLECIDMLLNCNEEDDGFQFILSISQTEVAKNNEKVCAIMLEGSEYSMDMMGFVKKSLQAEVAEKRLHNNIIDGIVDLMAGQFEITENGRKVLKSTVQNVVKKQSMLIKNKNDGEVAFPFYNLDLSYNVIKRVKRKKKIEYVMESQINNRKKHLKIGAFLSN